MRLEDYFQRIGFEGTPRADLQTFRAIHRAHAQAVSYENLDVQLQRTLTRDPAQAFDKIVTRRRGGWCYEMNGLLGAALDEIGFSVTRVAGAVHRELAGDRAIGNHLVLLVDLNGQTYVGDVGFGDGLIEPVPLREGPTRGNPLDARLEKIGAGWWRYVNDPRTGGPGFEFNPAIGDAALLEGNCIFLQTDPASPFVQNAVAQRWIGDDHYSMRGRVLRILGPRDETKQLIESADDYVATLRQTFGIDLPEAATLWPKIEARHREVFGDREP